MSTRKGRSGFPWRRTIGLVVAVAILGGIAKWLWWTEHHPEQERELRLQVQEQLHDWFPEQMALPDELFGFIPRSQRHDDSRPPDVLLLHGLDEPGGIWDELANAFDEAGINAWEFRYPNDQAIDHSTDLLAEHWPELDSDHELILIGHSMGGLVIRDFITRWRHPADADARVDGPAVAGVILVGTPNQGSEWARLRAWLELREWISDIRERRFSLFAALRDGTGAAKIDLRPDSRFLGELNERDWPDWVEMKIIGGVLAEPTPAMTESVSALVEQFGREGVVEELLERWDDIGAGLGDGVVPVESLALPDQPEPLVLDASHRGLLVPMPLTEGEPPAIEPVVKTVLEWQGEN
ncbi:alpha/beta hydrolase [Wenzhouxiangella sp. AB-CW3]|uniref:alpha/beta fold hydrolase n=1 Tax=Wenzhouxiangella sp. AB-CW3 TaxID=2771012 RepID=UPI00168B41A6|nr:alpha/beta fold hydrolase [Wenzhouxiangella sp. AB-CW3]QOC22878.1 alpha/beta hydrolase [Wenzhouxiangella sp. AB-CW3]